MHEAEFLEYFRSLIAAYLLLLAPGQAWWRGYHSILPPLFSQLVLSLIWTSSVALVLTIAEEFSLPLILLINGSATLLGFLFNLLGRINVPELVTRERDRIGPILVVAALLAFWPAYPTFYGSGDSTMYISGGVHLAATGRMSIDDSIPPKLRPSLRQDLFRSVHQFRPGDPPYSRTPGGLVLESQSAETAWPAFFPMPTIWAGIASGALGVRAAPGFAPLFAALALWPIFLVARRLTPLPLALAATLACAANGASYYLARFAMSEPIATFFIWAGIAALAAWEDEGRRGDLQLAGGAFGAAALARPELALVIAGVMALRGLVIPERSARRLSLAFFLPLAAMLLLTALEIGKIPGAYMAPVFEPAQHLFTRATTFLNQRPGMAAVAVASILGACATFARFRALGTAVRLSIAFIPAVGVTINSPMLGGRTLNWMWIYAGTATLVLAGVGAIALWRRRNESGAMVLVPVLFAVIGAALFWNPHVHPYLPWAARRLTPVLLPAAFVLAAAGIGAIARRSVVASMVALAICAAGVWPAGRAVWAHEFFEGSYEELERLADALPDDGPVVLNMNLNSYMFGTPLWLLYGRENFSVRPDKLISGRQQISSAAHSFGREQHIYYLTKALYEPRPIPFVRSEFVTHLYFARRLLEKTFDQMPTRRIRYPAKVALYKLTPLWPKTPKPGKHRVRRPLDSIRVPQDAQLGGDTSRRGERSNQ